MNNINTEVIENYVKSVVPKRNELLTRLEEYAHLNHVPIITSEVGQFLRTLVSYSKPKRILEVGTAIGYSGILLLQSDDSIEKLTTLEIKEEMVNIARENFEKAGFTEKVEIKLGDAKEVIKTLDNSFDFIFIDAAKGQYRYYFDEAMKLLSPKGIIVCDNVLYKGMVASETLVEKRKITIVRNLKSFIDYVMNFDEINSTLIPIGDGILLSMRG